MENLLRTFTLSILLVFVSCDLHFDSSPVLDITPRPSNNLIWVAKFFSGGIQCDTTSHYTPPDTKALLNAERIPVVDVMIEYWGTCAACGCPTYAAKHFALIEEQYLRAAERIGFTLQPLPWLYIHTDKIFYKYSDNLNFTIDNPTNKNAYITACNNKLTYWLEIFANFQWRNFMEINTGPCLDLYPPYIRFAPNQRLREQLALRTINNLESGAYRIKVEYRLENDPYSSTTYSNTFNIDCSEGPRPCIPDTLYGSWYWLKSVGGIAGMTHTPMSVGYTQKIVLSRDNVIRFYKNDSLVIMCPFDVYYITTSENDSTPAIHYFDTRKAIDQTINFATADTLILNDMCIDCFSNTYVRIR